MKRVFASDQMDSKNSKEAREHAAAPPSSRAALEADPDLPVYYDSEPSSQPPQYGDTSNAASTKSQSAARPQAHDNGSGVPASTIRALLADPDPEPESREKRSLRGRWKDWKQRNIHGDGDDLDRRWDMRGSSAQWNAFGASVSGYENKSRRLR